jgi:hypothetical protein
MCPPARAWVLKGHTLHPEYGQGVGKVVIGGIVHACPCVYRPVVVPWTELIDYDLRYGVGECRLQRRWGGMALERVVMAREGKARVGDVVNIFLLQNKRKEILTT